MSSKSKPPSYYIEAEVFISLIASIIFIVIVFNLPGKYWLDSYILEFFEFFGAISLIFFASVFAIGIPGAIKSKQSKNIPRAVLYSIIFWIVSIVLVAITSEVLYLFSAYIMLPGIIYGFYYGLNKKAQKQPAN